MTLSAKAKDKAIPLHFSLPSAYIYSLNNDYLLVSLSYLNISLYLETMVDFLAPTVNKTNYAITLQLLKAFIVKDTSYGIFFQFRGRAAHIHTHTQLRFNTPFQLRNGNQRLGNPLPQTFHGLKKTKTFYNDQSMDGPNSYQL